MRARLKSAMRESLRLSLLLAVIIAGRSTLADHYYVPSGSMEYTLIAGDRVFVDKAAYGYRVPFTGIELVDRDRVARGDVVIFDSPRDGKRLIKRIVAVGGDSVELTDGRLAINGRGLSAGPDREVFGGRVAELNLLDGGGPDIGMARVPDGMLLAVGDHRGNSLDGRMFGLIEERDVYGRAVAVYYRRGSGFVWKSL